MFKEMTTFVFFVMTGYKFRPASNNPYFSLPTEEQMEQVQILYGVCTGQKRQTIFWKCHDWGIY
jgi:hypothetical protein